ncbi:MAG: hypothetical protein IPO42_10785 [Chitinophagaceae bacterium]|nr:hypothetical protein [Chitinophagaceae bacterium]
MQSCFLLILNEWCGLGRQRRNLVSYGVVDLHAPFKNLYKKLQHFIITNHNYNEQAVLSFQDQRLLRSWLDKARMNFGATQKIFEVLEKKFNIIIDNKATLVNPITFQPGTDPAPYPAISHEPCIWGSNVTCFCNVPLLMPCP